MARYIDIDEFRKKLFYTEDGKKIPDHDCDNFPTTVSLIYLHHLIRNFPTADVAPRSEVAREIFGEIEANINALEYNARTPRKTVSVDELKAQMDWVLREVIPGTLAKIKQKYTEENEE